MGGSIEGPKKKLPQQSEILEAREHSKRVQAGLRQHGPLARAYLKPGSVHHESFGDFSQQFPTHQKTSGQLNVVFLPLPPGKLPEDAPKELDHPQYGHLRFVGPHTSSQETWVRGADGRFVGSASSSVQLMYQIVGPGRAAQPLQEAYLNPFEDSKIGGQSPVIDAQFEVVEDEGRPAAKGEPILPQQSKADGPEHSSTISDKIPSLEEIVGGKWFNNNPSSNIPFDLSKYSGPYKRNIIK
ncbi:hypothetical protein HYU14_05770 [Candidatus Woesearchaeota archaeon]|nr:hypothetical protein [Candidatus Woesearchaeota archaeon]